MKKFFCEIFFQTLLYTVFGILPGRDKGKCFFLSPIPLTFFLQSDYIRNVTVFFTVICISTPSGFPSSHPFGLMFVSGSYAHNFCGRPQGDCPAVHSCLARHPAFSLFFIILWDNGDESLLFHYGNIIVLLHKNCNFAMKKTLF